ncbi:MAG TPA: PKD domain-containing protein [Thermomicrobiaceae bacterium]|nr:PKD domain-containing protein [Thermomicrobiaceae bacterium]
MLSLLGMGLLPALLVPGPVAASGGPSITSITIIGTVSSGTYVQSPAIAVAGSGFDPAPAATSTAYGGFTGLDYGTELHFTDLTNNPHSWDAGYDNPSAGRHDLIGLADLNYTDTQISYTFGTVYPAYGGVYELHVGDQFRAYVRSVWSTGIVQVGTPIPCGYLSLHPTVTPNPVSLNGSASAGATDFLSGVASQGCDPINTGTAGTFSVNCWATNNAGDYVTGTASYTVNTPPTTSAGGPYSGASDAPIAIGGTASDADGDHVTTAWTVAANPGTTGSCTVADASALATSVSCTSPGSYTLTLSAGDGINPPVTSTAQLTLNAPPTVDAGGGTGGYSGTEGAAISLSGTATDVDGDTVTSQWTYTANPGTDGSCAVGDASSPTTTVSCTDQGNYTLTLSASDGVYTAVTSIAQVSVGNAPITVNAITGLPAAPLVVNGAVNVSATFSDPGTADGHVATWNWGDGSTPTTGSVTETVGSGAGCVAGTHTYAVPGVYTVTLTVSDGDSPASTGSSTAVVSVSYNVCALFDQTQAHHSGSTIPVKLQLCDASGANVSSSAVAITAVDVDGGPVATAGNANPGGVFRYDPTLGGYILNLKTSGLSAGTHTLDFPVGGDPVTHHVGFVVK